MNHFSPLGYRETGLTGDECSSTSVYVQQPANRVPGPGHISHISSRQLIKTSRSPRVEKFISLHLPSMPSGPLEAKHELQNSESLSKHRSIISLLEQHTRLAQQASVVLYYIILYYISSGVEG